MEKGKAIVQENKTTCEVADPSMTGSDPDSSLDDQVRILRSPQMQQSHNLHSVYLPTPYDTFDSGTSGSKLTPILDSFSNETCPEWIVDMKATEDCGSDGNANTVSDGTLPPPTSLNYEPSRSRLRIFSCARSFINSLRHHLREIRPTEGSWPKSLAGIVIPASASTGFNSSSSSVFTKIATAMAFSASLTAFSLRHDRGEAIPRYLVKLGATAYAAVVYEAIVNDLSVPTMWAVTVAFLIAILAVINA